MNHYEILEVSPNASQEVIKAAYKSLMQRYHPDKNPGDAKTTQHALLVNQAYEVLSDPLKRAAFDIECQQHAAERAGSAQAKRGSALARAAGAAEDGESHWFAWLLIAAVLLSGWFVLSRSERQQSPESELQKIFLSLKDDRLTPEQKQVKFKRIDEIVKTHPELLRKDAGERAQDEEARTIPVLIEKLSVNLRAPERSSGNPGQTSADAEHVLFIPILGVKVGTFDADKAIKYIERDKELIIQELAKKLVAAKYEELNKNDGEVYLKNIILDSIGETTGTDRREEYPASSTETPGRYGAIDVLLPNSFSVR